MWSADPGKACYFYYQGPEHVVLLPGHASPSHLLSSSLSVENPLQMLGKENFLRKNLRKLGRESENLEHLGQFFILRNRNFLRLDRGQPTATVKAIKLFKV